jgi:hypothetical protein
MSKSKNEAAPTHIVVDAESAKEIELALLSLAKKFQVQADRWLQGDDPVVRNAYQEEVHRLRALAMMIKSKRGGK